MEKFLNGISTIWDDNGSKIIFAIIVLFFGLILTRLFIRILKKILSKKSQHEALTSFITSTVRVILYVLLAITILQIFGVPTTSLVAALSVVGIALGLALQNVLSNVASGFIVLFTNPFKKGDYVMIDQFEGTIMETGILQTKISTLDNKVVLIPNSKITDGQITNYSALPTRCIILDISISYNNDFKKAISLINEIVQSDPLILKNNIEFEPFIRMYSHGDSAIILTVRVWTNTENYLIARSGLLEQIKETFDKNSISIPFPQIEVSVNEKHK